MHLSVTFYPTDLLSPFRLRLRIALATAGAM
jgi:hypothetical protein